MPLLNSCNKFDVKPDNLNSKKDVFEIATSAPNALVKMVAELKRQNELTGFLKDFVVKEGYPLWNKSIYQKVKKNNPAVFNARGGEETADTIVYTPIALLDSNFVNGFLLSKVFGDSVELHLYRANDYDLYPYGSADSSVVTAELITLTLAQLDYNCFGNTLFKIIDPNLKFELHPFDSVNSVRFLKLDNARIANPIFSGMVCVSIPSGVTNCHCGGVCHWKDKPDCTLCAALFCSLPIGTPPPLGGGTPATWPPDPPTSYSGGGNNPPPPTNCTGVNDCRPGSQIVEGRVPCGGCGSGPIVVIPPEEPSLNNHFDSIPNLISSICSQQMDSLYQWGMTNGFREQSFIVVKKNGIIYPKNFLPGFPSGDKTRVNYTLSSGEVLLAFVHTHAEDTVNFWRTSFSAEDLMEFNKNANVVGYTALLEVGNTRYAFVLEDVQKKSTFNINKRGNHVNLYEAILNSLISQFSNGQLLTEQAWIQFLGSVSVSGIGFYKSTAPNKNNFTKLNP